MPIKNKENGFSLIEMGVYVLILSVIISVSYGMFTKNLLNNKIRKAAYDLSAAFDLAKSYSRSYNELVEITFFTEMTDPTRIVGFQIGKNLNPNNPNDGGATVYEKIDIPKGLEIGTNNNVRKVQFRPNQSLVFIKIGNTIVANNDNLEFVFFPMDLPKRNYVLLYKNVGENKVFLKGF